MLDPARVGDHHDEFDVFHVHFGFDAQEPRMLADLVATLRGHGKPLVYTVHDLRNPHHRRPEQHLAQLDVLIPAADELITLTAGAAALIARRWGRTPVVLPHPYVVDPATVSTRRSEHDGFVIGLHAKSLRPNMAPLPVIDVLVDLVAELPGATLRVDLHTEVLDPAGYWHSPDVVDTLTTAAERGQLDLRVHDCFTDAELWDYLLSLDLSVLPYRFGTHSGWLEACHDLGTTVLTSNCGFYSQQRPCLTYGHDESGLDARSLATAVRTAYLDRPRWRADRRQRRHEQRLIAAEHHALYTSLLR